MKLRFLANLGVGKWEIYNQYNSTKWRMDPVEVQERKIQLGLGTWLGFDGMWVVEIREVYQYHWWYWMEFLHSWMWRTTRQAKRAWIIWVNLQPHWWGISYMFHGTTYSVMSNRRVVCEITILGWVGEAAKTKEQRRIGNVSAMMIFVNDRTLRVSV